MRLYPEDLEKGLMVFGSYAQYYDTIYKKKAYAKECAYLERLFRKHAPRKKIVTLLDLGCGTASHMIPFLRKGYKAAGVDASASMLKLAAGKLEALDLSATLVNAKLQTFRFNRPFDAVLCLFSVVDYLTQPRDVLAMMKNVAAHMSKTSLFIFDFWNESAVTGHYAPRKKNVYRENGRVIERSSTTKIDPARRLCEVSYVCSVKEKGKVFRRDREKHVLRCFAVDEMRDYLDTAGLKVVNAHPFLRENGRIRKNTWDVTMVARKR